MIQNMNTFWAHKYRDVFARDLSEVTQTKSASISIDTGSHDPIKQRP